MRLIRLTAYLKRAGISFELGDAAGTGRADAGCGSLRSQVGGRYLRERLDDVSGLLLPVVLVHGEVEV